MLGGPDEIALQQAIVPARGAMEKIQMAFQQAHEAAEKGKTYRNPLDQGEIIISHGGGPFSFIPYDDITGCHEEAHKGKQELVQEADSNEDFPRTELTFDLSDIMSLPDLNKDIETAPQLIAWPDAVQPTHHDAAPAQVEMTQDDDGAEEIVQVQHVPDDEPPSKKAPVTVTYVCRRSERLMLKQDGARVDSVGRATQRKATSAGESDSSVGSASTRRWKSRRLPDIDIDINKLAPLPVTQCLPETGMERLKELANCCGYLTLDAVEKALKRQEQVKASQGTSRPNE
jgi:hypothetical protein